MQPNNNGGSHSTAQHHPSLFPSDLLSEDFATTMRDIEDSGVPETAMADVRMEDTIRSENSGSTSQHQHLALSIPSPSVDAIDSGSPSTPAQYQTSMSSPTTASFTSSRTRSDPQTYSDAVTTSVKRSSAYFVDPSDDGLCNDSKRRRRDTPEVEDSNTEPSLTSSKTAESHRRSNSKPRLYRCRSHSLPDQTTITRILTGEIDPKKAGYLQHSRFPSVLLLPTLSSDISASFSSAQKRRIRDRPIPPPITRQSLRELESPEIMKNAQLIHDIIHDPSLQFRPNLEGPRGERKRISAEQYWSALEREVDRLKVCLRKDPNGLVKLSSNRFPVLFSELRDILCSLLPVADKIVVEEVIEPEFLCQQLFRGVLDVEKLALFLSRTMKEHCAPMRDAMIDKMVEQFRYARESGESSAFVLGLRMVFELLEGMKLDVANHQLRTMKKDLQDRAVVNEREYFEDRIAKGKIDLNVVINWVKPYFQADSSSQYFLAFSKAFVELLTPSSSAAIPSTFLFDTPRLHNFRKDFNDLISVQLCLLLYRELAVSMHPTNTPPSEAAFNALRLEIWSIISDLPESDKYSIAAASLAVQITLRAAQHSNPDITVPASRLVSVAQRWIEQNVVATDSKLFTISEKRVQEYFVQHLLSAQGKCIPQTPLRTEEFGRTGMTWAIGTEHAMWLLAERMHRVAAFHWVVFGDVYVRESLEE